MKQQKERGGRGGSRYLKMEGQGTRHESSKKV